MSIPFYAKSPDNQGYIKNLEVVGFTDLGQSAAFQLAVYKPDKDKYYIYATTRAGDSREKGVMILDVTDPATPKHVKTIELFDPTECPTSKPLKLQVADDLLIVALLSGGGPAATNPVSALTDIKFMNGIQIYSLKEDPLNPVLLSYWDTGVPKSFGVHRFMYNGGRYVHLASDALGFEGMIYRILDIEDPKKPVEIGRWWLPEQYVDGYPGRTYDPSQPHIPQFMDKGHFHGPPFVRDGKCYMGYGGAGFIILDVEDFTRPKCLSQLRFQPAMSGGLGGARTHTALPLPGRDLAVVTNEGERYAWFTPERIRTAGPQPMNNIHMVDVSDPARPTLIAQFPYPEVPPSFPYKNFNVAGLGIAGPFGPHNIHEPMEGKPGLELRADRVYCCYFHAGLRVFDVSDEYNVKELAYFIPPNPTVIHYPTFPGPRLATTEDCLVDDRGYIFISCLEDGVYVLKMKE